MKHIKVLHIEKIINCPRAADWTYIYILCSTWDRTSKAKKELHSSKAGILVKVSKMNKAYTERDYLEIITKVISKISYIIHTLKKCYHQSHHRISWMEKWKYLWSMCTSFHVLPVFLWFLNYSIMWNTCKGRGTVFEYLWLLQPLQTCSNWNATEAPKLLSVFLLVYCVSIHTLVIYMICIYIMDILLDPYTHKYTNTHS